MGELSSRLEKRAADLSAKGHAIREDIREAAAGFIHIEIVGVCLFGLGSYLSTFSKELSGCQFIFG